MSKKKVAEQRSSMGKSKKQKKKPSRFVPSTIDRPIAQSSMASALNATPPVASSASSTSVIRTQARTQQTARTQRQALVTDYRYVVSDLKRIGMLAVAMFAIIIILSFVIR